MREKEGDKESPSFSLRSKEFCWSIFVGPRIKFIASTKGMRGYLEQEILSRIQERKFWKIEVVGFMRLPTHSSTLQEVRILPNLVLVPNFRLIFRLKWWNVLRVCLGRKMSKT